MKSIKEKSEEHLNSVYAGYDNVLKTLVKEGYETGANYVLDILKKELPLEDNRNLNDYGKALVWRLKECIEQLKK